MTCSARLDVVVASVHSKLRMPAEPMTQPHARRRRPTRTSTCSATAPAAWWPGRRGRPESQFDAEAVFAACREHGVAVEINCRPERQDPPDRLLRLAADIGCQFAIDTDAHAPGQLDWLDSGCVRAEQAGIEPTGCSTPGMPRTSDTDAVHHRQRPCR